MDNNRSNSYVRWTWIIAVVLALILLWMLLTNTGHSGCCHHAALATTDRTEAPEAFSFSASADDFTSNGDTHNIAWINNVDALKNLLSGNLTLAGNDQTITLSGAVDSEEDKLQKGLDAQSFFGTNVTIDNQIIVTAAETATTAPPSAKLYFDSGYHRLPADGAALLDDTVTFLKNNPDKTAIISGYHDTTGNLASNQALAKKRAQSVYDVLVAAGISANKIEMRKPASADGGGSLDEARRVEVSIE
jgi:outer membrane protein OmpA-like peptidoglycan-associated protein